jgi:hypothetical protein
MYQEHAAQYQQHRKDKAGNRSAARIRDPRYLGLRIFALYKIQRRTSEEAEDHSWTQNQSSVHRDHFRPSPGDAGNRARSSLTNTRSFSV